MSPIDRSRLKHTIRTSLLWLLRALVVSVALLVLFIIVTPQGRTGFHTLLFVLQTLEMPVSPQSWFTDEPLRHEGIYGSDDGVELADIYRVSDGRPRAAVLLALGTSPYGLDDPNVVNLGNALARAGYVAFDYLLPGEGGPLTQLGQAARLFRHMYDVIRIAS